MVEHVWGIVAAAGEARRFGGDKLAQRLTNGDTVLYRSCAQLLAGGLKRLVIVGTLGADHQLERLGDAIHAIVPGGAQRSDSVRAGLAALPAEVKWVAVHDGARPFVRADLIKRCVSAAQKTGAAVPVLECVDTIALTRHGQLNGTFDRTQLRRIQTPQIMKRSWLEEVATQVSASDESSVLQALGYPVATVAGEEENIKLTYPKDLNRTARRYVTGMGFDVHRFDAQRPLYLGGLHIENEDGLVGHSDADVILHALVDAILGGLSAGDIGSHFPPSDQRYKDAPSNLFVKHTMELVRSAGARLEHVDLTLIGERPRLTPHRDRIRAHLSDLLELTITSISLKATTTEGLGFTGRGEGLAAQAVATLSLPVVEGESS